MAVNQFITAPIGGGKSLWGIIKICEQLERTEQLIVTNIPIILHIAYNPERLQTLAEMILETSTKSRRDREMYWTIQEYCDAFIKHPVNVAERVIYLNEEQSREFYLYVPRNGIELTAEQMEASGVTMWRQENDAERLSYGYKLARRPHPQHKWLVDYRPRGRSNGDGVTGILRNGTSSGGVNYHMDEFHKLFPIRTHTADGDQQFEDYESELRKLNDNLYKYSQHPEKVLKNSRRNTTDWMQVQNLAKTPLFMGVTFSSKFRWHWYNQDATPTRSDKPTSSGWYKLDPKRRQHFLYRTLQGSSIAGEGVTETANYKGRHWAVWILAIIAIIAFAVALPVVLDFVSRKLVTGLVSGMQRGVQKGVMNALPNSTPPAPAPKPNLPAPPPTVEPHARSLSPRPSAAFPASPAGGGGGFNPYGQQIKCVGWCNIDGDICVFLADGTVLRQSAGEVQDVGRRYVKILGMPPIPIEPEPK